MLTALGAAPPTGVAVAEGLLSSGRPGLALNAAEAAGPDPRARIVAARARAALGVCGSALAELAELRGAPGWGPAALLAEAHCQRSGGARAAELVSLYEAVCLDPRDDSAFARLVRAADEAGEEALAAWGREHLLGTPAGVEELVLADARRAVLRGLDDADQRLMEALPLRRRSSAHRVAVAILEGRRWLDLGWPERGAQALFEAVRADLADPVAAAWRAEALRRSGDWAQADAALTRPRIAAGEPAPLATAIRARVAIDRGDPAGARALLEQLPDPVTAEALASRWYVARATGRDADALEARWRLADPNPARSLDQLVPP